MGVQDTSVYTKNFLIKKNDGVDYVSTDLYRHIVLTDSVEEEGSVGREGRIHTDDDQG